MSAIFRFFRQKFKGKMTEDGEDNDGNDKGEVALNNNILPPELLEKIFSHLSSLQDLNTVMLVCKTWNDVAEAPVFWSWFKITKPSQLPLKRLRGCQQIVIGESLSRDKEGKITEICWTRLFQEILQHPGLKKITLNQSWLIYRKLAFGKMLPVNPYFYIFVTKLSFV